MQRELISRGTMAVVAIGLATASTRLLLYFINAEKWMANNSAYDDLAMIRLLIPIIIVLYILAAVFGCFVFSAWDKRSSNIGRVMSIGDKVSGALTWTARIFFWRWFD
jgi:hypothetical protein